MPSGETLKCLLCFYEKKVRKMGLKCPSGHYFCPECAKSFIESGITNYDICLPYKCYKCNKEFELEKIFSRMSESQREKLAMYQAIEVLGQDKFEIVNCPYCDFVSVWAKNSTNNLLYCPNNECKKGSCRICFEEFKVPDKLDFTPEEITKMEKDGILKHHECFKYKTMKEDWDEAIDQGHQRECPGCHAKGIKNTGCTSMKCPHCGTAWCYFCGLSENNCDKSDPNGDMHKHNINWQKNKKRCPLFLLEIWNIDKRWDKNDDAKCLEFLHKILLSKAIRNFFMKYSETQFQTLCNKFADVKNHGIDLKEAKTMDLTLIKRRLPPPPQPVRPVPTPSRTTSTSSQSSSGWDCIIQ
ncbi:unnamed protein product [Moneuplotes crassus]|uniref:RING-type domain-containing protein n=1 Tax=Euplotes crassus TaxID=5936 RepID=A0AAD1UBD2_EUPCR|nr:unnamed protein product [Moneuplotes crassus]